MNATLMCVALLVPGYGEKEIVERIIDAGGGVLFHKSGKGSMVRMPEQATDDDIGELCELRDLYVLSLAGTKLTDKGLHTVADLRGLQNLFCNQTPPPHTPPPPPPPHPPPPPPPPPHHPPPTPPTPHHPPPPPEPPPPPSLYPPPPPPPPLPPHLPPPPLPPPPPPPSPPLLPPPPPPSPPPSHHRQGSSPLGVPEQSRVPGPSPLSEHQRRWRCQVAEGTAEVRHQPLTPPATPPLAQKPRRRHSPRHRAGGCCCCWRAADVTSKAASAVSPFSSCACRGAHTERPAAATVLRACWPGPAPFLLLLAFTASARRARKPYLPRSPPRHWR